MLRPAKREDVDNVKDNLFSLHLTQNFIFDKEKKKKRKKHLYLFPPTNLGKRRASVDAPQPHLSTSKSDLVTFRHPLRDGFLFVLKTGRRARLDDLHVNAIAQLVFVSKVRGRRASVEKVFGRVLSGHVREPKLSFGIHGQAGVVDGLEPILSLEKCVRV